jgi:hypothetical protein
MWNYGWTKAQLLSGEWQIKKTHFESPTWDCGHETKNLVNAKVNKVESARNGIGVGKEVQGPSEWTLKSFWPGIE